MGYIPPRWGEVVLNGMASRMLFGFARSDLIGENRAMVGASRVPSLA